jgi:carboxymethylenebutenolidase
MYDGIREVMAGSPGSELHRYEGAGHAFLNEEGDRYDPEAAAQAWPRAVDFFHTHLG